MKIMIPTVPFSHFLENDPGWAEKFHVWKMDWTKEYIRLYLDDKLLNEVDYVRVYQKE